MPLYAQGYSLAEYLIQVGGRPAFLKFLAAGMADDQWSAAVAQHYNLRDLAVLQNSWLAWVQQGSPRLEPRGPKSTPVLASNRPADLLARPSPNLVLRQPKELASSGWYPGSTRPWSGGPIPSQAASPQPVQSPGGN
jgi:hypothetical protein